jgi:hypothetical protein
MTYAYPIILFCFIAPGELDAQVSSSSRSLLEPLMKQVLSDLKREAVHPTPPQPYEPGWVIRFNSVDSALESRFRSRVLAMVNGRAARAEDQRVQFLRVDEPIVEGDSALILVDRGTRWCDHGTLSMAGMISEYRFVKTGDRWRMLRRDRGMFYDPPPPSSDVTASTCIAAYAR